MPATSRLVRAAPIGFAVVLCMSCSSGSHSSGALPTADSPYPSSIVALGHSGLTGYDSDPDMPAIDVHDNSWATGTNPKVDSVYERIVALNPAARDHVSNFAIDGSGVDSLVDQERQAAAVTPAPDLVIIRNYGLEVERVEQLALVALAPPHHRTAPSMPPPQRRESRFAGPLNPVLQQNRSSSGEHRLVAARPMIESSVLVMDVCERGSAHNVGCGHKWR